MHGLRIGVVPVHAEGGVLIIFEASFFFLRCSSQVYYLKNSYNPDKNYYSYTVMSLEQPYSGYVKTGDTSYLGYVNFRDQVSCDYSIIYTPKKGSRWTSNFLWFKFNLDLWNSIYIRSVLDQTDITQKPTNITIPNPTVSKLVLDIADYNHPIMRAYVITSCETSNIFKKKKRWEREEEFAYWDKISQDIGDNPLNEINRTLTWRHMV